MYTTQQMDAIAEAVNDRAQELTLSQAALARASGMSVLTVRRVQNAVEGNYRNPTLDRIAKALGWPAGTLQRIAAGHRPPEVEESDAELRERLLSLQAQMDDLVRHVVGDDRDDG